MGDFAMMTGVMASLYLIGVLLHYAYNWIIDQYDTKIQRNIRDQMFESMQKLPVRFFDTHANGDIMSCYTNDTDTLRELMANGVPYLISNGLTVLAIFVAMMIINWLLTLFIVVMLVIMFFIVKYVGGKSGKHFVRQQKAIGVLDGYVEEHIEGMRVVKVFCHEDAEKEAFDGINAKLRGASRKAHTYANVLMPILGNIGYINYAITAHSRLALHRGGHPCGRHNGAGQPHRLPAILPTVQRAHRADVPADEQHPHGARRRRTHICAHRLRAPRRTRVTSPS